MNIENQKEQTEITYPLTERPAPGTTMEVAPGVRWLAMPMPGSLGFINLYLLEDIAGWWIVDTGLNNEQTKDLWGKIFADELQGKPVIGVICTHMHPDHIGQSLMITNKFQCTIFCCR